MFPNTPISKHWGIRTRETHSLNITSLITSPHVYLLRQPQKGGLARLAQGLASSLRLGIGTIENSGVSRAFLALAHVSRPRLIT